MGGIDLSGVHRFDVLPAEQARQAVLLFEYAVGFADRWQAGDVAKHGRALLEPCGLVLSCLVGLVEGICGADPEAAGRLKKVVADLERVRTEYEGTRDLWERLTPEQRAEVTS